jgi:hypothetical protein
MSGYTSGQKTAMDNAIAQANSAEAAGNTQGVVSALNAYYSAQTAVRGYAILAMDVLNNTPDTPGVVANQEVRDAVGQSVYTTAYQANLALQLANVDFTTIQGDGYQVPTLADDAAEHMTVFNDLGISIDAWGGTTYTVLGQDFTGGLATPVELSSIITPQFGTLTAADVSASLFSLLVAGEESISSLTEGQAAQGALEIKTGRRTVISYLLSPLRQYAHEGIRER